jgi:transcriptional regulator with XRE-family HTH domain
MNARSNQDLGKRVKRIRLERGFTLKDVEAKVGVSATHVSEVERGKTSPTIGILGKIAHALEVDPAFLIDLPCARPFHVAPRTGRDRFGIERGRIQMESLTNGLARSELTAMVMTLPPDPAPPVVRRHDGEEFVLVLDGCLEVHTGEEVVRVEAGDSLHFRARSSHAVRNPGGEPCTALWASCPKVVL